MLSFTEFILTEAGLDSPDHMLKTFKDYFRYTPGTVNIDKKNKNRLNFHTSKSEAKNIIAIIDSRLGFHKNKLFSTSPITSDGDSRMFNFSITFNSNNLIS